MRLRMLSLRTIFSLLLLHMCYASDEGDRDSTRRSSGRFRIIAGRLATTLEFPYQAAMEHYGQQWCGGSILSERVLVTAAHCVQTIKNKSPIPTAVMQVRVGNDETSTGGEVYAIKKAVPHELYDLNPSVDEHDIALLFLTVDLNFGKRVQPVSLAKREPSDGEMGYVTGFGRQDPMRRKANGRRHLMAVEIPIMNRDKCKQIHSKYGNIVTDNMICAGNTKGHKDSCKGDSGGPLVVNNELAGVVAWGIGCGREGIPGVYTSIPRYVKWIESHIESELYDSSTRLDELLARLFRFRDM